MFKKIAQTLFAAFAVSMVFIAMPQNVSAKDADGNIVIVVDPGHGEKDPGAVGTTGVHEADVNYAIATGIKAELEKYEGVKVYLTRPQDSWTTNTGRAMVAKALNADFIISCHNNTGNQQGTIVYASLNQYYSDKTTQLGNQILSNLSALGLANKGVQTRKSTDGKEDYYTLIAESVRAGIPAVLVEHCFLDNSTDVMHVSTADGNVDYDKTAQIGQADAQAFVKYFNLKEKKTEPDSSVTLENGYKVQINATAGSSFTSKNESVAKVDANGLVTAVGPGTATIECKLADGSSASTEITVNKPKEVAISCGIDPTFYESQSKLSQIKLDTVITELFMSDGTVTKVKPDSIGTVDSTKVGVQDIPVTYGSLKGFLRVIMNSDEYDPEVTLPAEGPAETKAPATVTTDETTTDFLSSLNTDNNKSSDIDKDGLDPVFKYLAILAVVVVIGLVLFIVENNRKNKRRRRNRSRRRY